MNYHALNAFILFLNECGDLLNPSKMRYLKPIYSQGFWYSCISFTANDWRFPEAIKRINNQLSKILK